MATRVKRRFLRKQKRFRRKCYHDAFVVWKNAVSAIVAFVTDEGVKKFAYIDRRSSAINEQTFSYIKVMPLGCKIEIKLGRFNPKHQRYSVKLSKEPCYVPKTKGELQEWLEGCHISMKEKFIRSLLSKWPLNSNKTPKHQDSLCYALSIVGWVNVLDVKEGMHFFHAIGKSNLITVVKSGDEEFLRRLFVTSRWWIQEGLRSTYYNFVHILCHFYSDVLAVALERLVKYPNVYHDMLRQVVPSGHTLVMMLCERGNIDFITYIFKTIPKKIARTILEQKRSRGATALSVAVEMCGIAAKEMLWHCEPEDLLAKDHAQSGVRKYIHNRNYHDDSERLSFEPTVPAICVAQRTSMDNASYPHVFKYLQTLEPTILRELLLKSGRIILRKWYPIRADVIPKPIEATCFDFRITMLEMFSSDKEFQFKIWVEIAHDPLNVPQEYIVLVWLTKQPKERQLYFIQRIVRSHYVDFFANKGILQNLISEMDLTPSLFSRQVISQFFLKNPRTFKAVFKHSSLVGLLLIKIVAVFPEVSFYEPGQRNAASKYVVGLLSPGKSWSESDMKRFERACVVVQGHEGVYEPLKGICKHREITQMQAWNMRTLLTYYLDYGVAETILAFTGRYLGHLSLFSHF